MRTCISGCRPTRLRVEVSPSEAPTLIRPFAAEIEEHVSAKNIEYPASEHKNILLRCAYSGGPRDLGSGKKSERLCRAAAVSLAVSLSSFAGLVPHAKGAVDQRAVDAAWMMFCCGSEGKGDTSEILVRWSGCSGFTAPKRERLSPLPASHVAAHSTHQARPRAWWIQRPTPRRAGSRVGLRGATRKLFLWRARSSAWRFSGFVPAQVIHGIIQ